MEELIYKKFSEINLENEFFDSLKSDYAEFSNWFIRKSNENEHAYVQISDDRIDGFLYLKIENGPITDVTPEIVCDKAVKIGTMKITPHGTRLGERFIKKSLDYAILNCINHVYVTVFDRHTTLINLYERYGFVKVSTKSSTNGVENVLVKRLDVDNGNYLKNYPRINTKSKAYLLSIKPEYHTKLFPDSILNTENFDIVKDISHTNSIEKIYICRMPGVSSLKPGDLLVMYRTTDRTGQANFRSVVSSICTVESLRHISSFSSYNDLKIHCKNYSIFTDSNLAYFYKKGNYFVLKMTYNVAFPKRLTRLHLISNVGLNKDDYWGILALDELQLSKILNDSLVNSNYFL